MSAPKPVSASASQPGCMPPRTHLAARKYTPGPATAAGSRASTRTSPYNHLIAAMSPASFDTRRARLLLRELRECQRASAERESCRRLDALEGVEAAIQRIGEIGS